MKTLIICIFCLFCSVYSYSQDKILFINGTQDSCKVIDTTGTSIKVEYKTKKGVKQDKIEKDDIFSIIYGGTNKEEMVYKQDTLSQENFLPESDMRAMIAGERDALLSFKTPGAIASSIAIGAASGFFMPYLLAPVIPAIWVGLNSSRWIKIKRKNVTNKQYIKEDMYVVGYGRTARGLRVQNSLKAAGVGLVGGILGKIIYNSIKNSSTN